MKKTATKPKSATLRQVRSSLRELANEEIAKHSQRFFKTGPGEYGAGDHFLGIRVPVLRAQAKRYRALSTEQAFKILKSKWHEERLFALIVLCQNFERADDDEKKEIFDGYLADVRFINNWDLVDTSCHKIIAPYLEKRNRKILHTLAKSKNLWERRIAIVSTYYYIKRDDFDDLLKLASTLLHDDEDLIHKGVGWMLREAGNRDISVLRSFLDQHHQKMPRTMLRYAIEKLEKKERAKYMAR